MSQCPPGYDGPIWVDCKHEKEYEKMTKTCEICGAAVCRQCRVCEMCKVFEELGAVNYLEFEARSDERLKAENTAYCPSALSRLVGEAAFLWRETERTGDA